jgi:hypothetical protein
MTATITVKQESTFGNKRIVEFSAALGSYSTGGVSVTPSDIGMTSIDIMLIAPSTDGIEYEYNYTTQVIKAYRAGGLIPTGNVADKAITVSGANVTVKGATATGVDLQLSTATATGVLGKLTATDRVITLPVFGLGAPSAVYATTPTFSGIATQSGLIEVDSATLSTACYCLAIGN